MPPGTLPPPPPTPANVLRLSCLDCMVGNRRRAATSRREPAA